MLKFFRLPFATTGDKTAVPDAVDTNGNVNYSQGYGFDYQRQKTDPAAKNIERDKMNQIFFDMTTAIAELQSQGVPDFITTALNGGTAYSYEQFAIVRYAGDLYISLEAANTADPTDPTKWALLPTPARIQAAFNTSAVAGGTADALTGAFSPAIAALPAAPGTLSVLVRAGSANTTTTPTFSPDGLTAKTIVKGNNLPLAVGDIAGAGHWLDLQYDATLDKWVLLNPYAPVAFASSAEAQAQTDNTKALSPLRLKEALQGANQSLAASGYQKLPGGLILQWSSFMTSVAGFTTYTFPIAFPNACLHVLQNTQSAASLIGTPLCNLGARTTTTVPLAMANNTNGFLAVAQTVFSLGY